MPLHTFLAWPLIAVAALTGCQASALPAVVSRGLHANERQAFHVAPGTGAGVQPMPDNGLGARWRPVGASASASEPKQAPDLAMDGNESTFWSSGPQPDQASLTLAFPKRRAFRWALIKTGPLPKGVTFKFMVSDDGVQWTPGSPRHMNTTWTKQVQEIMGEGKFLQVRYFNSDEGAATSYKVYEIELFGGID